MIPVDSFIEEVLISIIEILEYQIKSIVKLISNSLALVAIGNEFFIEVFTSHKE